MYTHHALKCMLLFLLTITAWATPCYARQVTVPLRFDVSMIRQTLLSQLYTAPGQKAVIMDDGLGCQWLYLTEPQVDVVAGRLRITSRAEAGAGIVINNQCISGPPWQGFVEAFEESRFDNATNTFTLRTVESNLYDASRARKLTAGPIWNLIKKPVHDRIGEIRIDFNPLLAELRSILAQSLPWTQEELKHLLDSIKVGQPVLADSSITLAITGDISRPPEYSTNAPEPALSPEEIEAAKKSLQQWDAFLTFIVKALARGDSGTVQHSLLDILLDARYELAEALTALPSGTADPVPKLFIHTWERLAPVVRELTKDRPEQTSLHYMSFITAADALLTLNAVGPEFGLEISADGLRRLARMLDPSGVVDPLVYSIEVDPELRKLLGLGPPLPAPNISPEVDMILSPGSFVLKSLNTYACMPSRLWVRIGLWLFPDAQAAIDGGDLQKLNSWAPAKKDLNEYLPLVQSLLQSAGGQTLAEGGLPAEYQQLYNDLVLATAWQESCWRHFVRNGTKLTALKSNAGSVGLMQINENVWRGIYDIKGLYGDIAYNARAGSEILMHYLKDYALGKGEQLQPGGKDNLARATYAVYNGGPGHLTRYRTASTKAFLKKIDALFWEKYSAVRAGRVLEVANCYDE